MNLKNRDGKLLQLFYLHHFGRSGGFVDGFMSPVAQWNRSVVEKAVSNVVANGGFKNNEVDNLIKIFLVHIYI